MSRQKVKSLVQRIGKSAPQQAWKFALRSYGHQRAGTATGTDSEFAQHRLHRRKVHEGSRSDDAGASVGGLVKVPTGSVDGHEIVGTNGERTFRLRDTSILRAALGEASVPS